MTLFCRKPINSRILERISYPSVYLVLCIVAHAQTGFAGQLDLAWDPSPSPDVGGYRIYYGKNAGNYPDSVDAGNRTSFTVPNLTDGDTYYLVATTYNTGGTAESAFSNQLIATVPGAGAPVASFTATTTSGVAPLTVTFTDTSTGNINSRAWDFGNSLKGSGTTASTSFAEAGSYVVTLTATGPGGSDTASKTIKVSAPTAAPVAAFSANPTNGTAPLAVTVSDSSTGATAWSWTFGDGASSTAQNPAHTYSSAGTYTVKLSVTGPGGSNTTTKNGYISVVTGGPSDGGVSGNTGLVAAYGFEELSGTSVTDSSGNGNHGAVSGGNSIVGGRFGKARNFNGTNTLVTIDDSASLDLSKEITLEAWVYPTVWMNRGNTILAKEDGASNTAYYLYANEDLDQPATGARISGYQLVTGTTRLPPNKWAHLAGTYDGQYLRLYVDGTQVDMQPQTGPIPISSGKLRLGGNTVWGEYLNGYLDDVRIYARALTPAEIAADAKSPVVSLWYSTSADRRNAKPLDQAALSGAIYVFTKPDNGVSVKQVDFWLDNTNPASPKGSPKQTDTRAPYDLAGGSRTRARSSTFPAGKHTVTARYTMSDGAVIPFVINTFTVK